MPAAILLKKKEESDAKALSIVEKLIEPQVDVQWMLDNVSYFFFFRVRYFSLNTEK